MWNSSFDSASHGTMITTRKFVNQNGTFLLLPPLRHMECLRKGDRKKIQDQENKVESCEVCLFYVT